MALLNIVQAINKTLEQQMEKDPTVVVYGEDVGVEGGVFRATQGLQQKFGEERCFDTPISEAAIVGTGVGMAINGLKPVAEIQFDGFLFPAMSQIVAHVSRMRTRSRGRFTVPMVIRFPYGGGIRAPIAKGEITIGDVISVLPFGNDPVIVTLTGAELKEIFERSVSSVPNEFGGFLHVSGMKFEFDSRMEPGNRIQAMYVNMNGEWEEITADGDFLIYIPLKEE